MRVRVERQLVCRPNEFIECYIRGQNGHRIVSFVVVTGGAIVATVSARKQKQEIADRQQ